MSTEQKTLLLVEDDALLAMTEIHWLKKAGYKIIHVMTGEAAIQSVNRINDDRIDLILMDINLGHGIDGTQAAQEILKDNDIPLLFLSSHTEKEIVEKTERITSFGYVVKDSNDVVLIASIKMAFKLHEANTRLVAQTKALHFSEEKFSKAFYTSPDSVAINRLSDGVYFEINDGFTNLTGYSAEEVLGRSSLPGHLSIWVDAADRDKLIQGLKEFGEVSNLEAKFRFKSGKVHVGLMSARIIEIDGEKYILSITRDITDRKQIEEMLSLNEEKYRLLLDLAADSFFQGDANGNFITVNNKAADLTGYSKEELLCMNMKDLFPHNILDEKPLRYDLLEKGQTIRIEREIVRKDGQTVSVEMNSKKMPDGTFQSFIRDISERRLSEKALSNSEKKYRDLFEKTDDAILIIEGGKFADCNYAALEMLRYKSKEQLLETHPAELSPDTQPDGRDSFEKANEMMLCAFEKGSHRFEWLHKKADGELFNVEVLLTSINTAENNNILHAVWRDITERKRAERYLKEGEERYRTLFDLSPSGIMLLDTEGNIINVNTAACKTTDYSKEDLLGKNIRMLVDSKYAWQVDSHIERLLAGDTLEHEVINISKDGTPKTVELRESLIILPDGSTGILSITNDVSERKIIEERLRSSENFHRRLIENTGAVPFHLIYGDKFGTGYYKFIGKEIENIIGFSPEIIDEGFANSLAIKIVPLRSDIPMDPLECRKRIMSGELVQFDADILIKTKSGALKWINQSSLPIWDDSHSKVIGAMGILNDISERKFAEEELKKSEEKFRLFVERIPDAVYKSTHDGKFLEVNPALVQMLGYESEEELKSIDIKKDLYFEPADRESAALIEKYEEMAIFRLRKKDGSEVWVEDHGRHVLNEKGEILYHEGIMRDVTERLKTETGLRESEERFRTIFENNSSAIAIIDPDTTIVMVNDAYCQMSGYTKEEVVGLSWTKQIPPEDLDRLKEYNRRRLNNPNDAPSKYDFKFYNKNGEVRHGIMSVALMQSKKEIITSFIDITDRMKADEAFHEMNEIFRLFMKHNPVYVFINDERLRPVYLSDNFEQMLGRPITEILGKNIYEFYPAEYSAKMEQDDINILRNSEQGEFIEEFNGRIYSTLKFPIILNGVPKYLVGYTTDITDRRRSEIELRKSAEELKTANASKDKFFSIIAHDLKNPFHSINSALKLVLNKEEILTEEEKENFLVRVLNTSEKAYSLLENLLLWSRSQMKSLDFKMEKIDVYEAIVENTELLKNGAMLKNISIENRVYQNNFVLADRNTLETVVRNILSNAIKFTKDNGTIVIDSAVRNGSVEIIISDNGIGIEPANLDKLFKINQAFSTHGTKKEAGSGLGLILCKEFVEKNNGTLMIESVLGSGTKVKFTLPSAK